jgi:Ca2+-binding RTX toxin-like protein
LLLGEDGDDVLDGGSGNDTLVGGPGRDDLSGGPGDDALWYDSGPAAWLSDYGRSSFGGAGYDYWRVDPPSFIVTPTSVGPWIFFDGLRLPDGDRTGSETLVFHDGLGLFLSPSELALVRYFGLDASQRDGAKGNVSGPPRPATTRPWEDAPSRESVGERSGSEDLGETWVVDWGGAFGGFASHKSRTQRGLQA